VDDLASAVVSSRRLLRLRNTNLPKQLMANHPSFTLLRQNQDLAVTLGDVVNVSRPSIALREITILRGRLPL